MSEACPVVHSLLNKMVADDNLMDRITALAHSWAEERSLSMVLNCKHLFLGEVAVLHYSFSLGLTKLGKRWRFEETNCMETNLVHVL